MCTKQQLQKNYYKNTLSVHRVGPVPGLCLRWPFKFEFRIFHYLLTFVFRIVGRSDGSDRCAAHVQLVHEQNAHAPATERYCSVIMWSCKSRVILQNLRSKKRAQKNNVTSNRFLPPQWIFKLTERDKTKQNKRKKKRKRIAMRTLTAVCLAYDCCEYVVEYENDFVPALRTAYVRLWVRLWFNIFYRVRAHRRMYEAHTHTHICPTSCGSLLG